MTSIENARIVVTGGAGFIGSCVVDSLLQSGAKEVVVIDNLSRGRWENLTEANKSGRLRLVVGDIRDRDLVERTFQGADLAIHEAALRITQCASDVRLCHEVLVDGTFNVLAAVVNNGVKRLVFNSSSSVYGEPSYLPIDEDHPYNNKTAYGAGKIANEQMARAFAAQFGLNYIALRPFSVYGPRMDTWGVYTEVFIRWLEAIERGQPPVIFGDGKSTSNDYIFISDVVEATMAAITSGVSEGVYNVGTGKETSLNDLCALILELTKSPLVPEHEGPDRVRIVSRRYANVAKTRKELGFRAKIELEDGLKELISWRKNEKAKGN